MKGTNRIHSRP